MMPGVCRMPGERKMVARRRGWHHAYFVTLGGCLRVNTQVVSSLCPA